MPHLIIEFSQDFNIELAIKLGREIQQHMQQLIEGKFDADQCKIRYIAYNNFTVGYSSQASFVHLTLKILTGRSIETKQKLSELCFASMQKIYQCNNRLDLSCDIVEMQKETYQKTTITI